MGAAAVAAGGGLGWGEVETAAGWGDGGSSGGVVGGVCQGDGWGGGGGGGWGARSRVCGSGDVSKPVPGAIKSVTPAAIKNEDSRVPEGQ